MSKFKESYTHTFFNDAFEKAKGLKLLHAYWDKNFNEFVFRFQKRKGRNIDLEIKIEPSTTVRIRTE